MKVPVDNINMLFRNSILSFFLLLLCVSSSAQDKYSKAINMAIDNFILHERRLLATADFFGVYINPERNVLWIGEDICKYPIYLSPKDTSIVLYCNDELSPLIWYDHNSQDIILSLMDYGELNYTIIFSEDAVDMDMSMVPNCLFSQNGKLFVWDDKTRGESKIVTDTLLARNRISYELSNLPLFDFPTDDGLEVVCYDLEKLQQGRIKKYHDHGIFGKGLKGRLKSAWMSFRYSAGR
jgi:hypothetical protein